MYKFIPIVCLLCFSSPINAKKTKVYRWVDKNNVVHFSHLHPTDTDFAQVDINFAYSANLPKETGTTFVDEWLAERKAAQEAKDELKRIEQAKEITKQNCQAAQMNLTALSGVERILIKNPDGSSRILTVEEKQEQRKINKQHVEQYCNNKATK